MNIDPKQLADRIITLIVAVAVTLGLAWAMTEANECPDGQGRNSNSFCEPTP